MSEKQVLSKQCIVKMLCFIILQCLLAKAQQKKGQGPLLSTDGIDIESWKPDEEDKEKANPVEFSVWDFGGQEGDALNFFQLIMFSILCQPSVLH